MLMHSRSRISRGVADRTRSLEKCQLLLKVLKDAGLWGGRGFVFECSRISEMVALDFRTLF